MNYINLTMFLNIKILISKFFLTFIFVILFSFISFNNVNTREVPGAAYDCDKLSHAHPTHTALRSPLLYLRVTTAYLRMQHQ